MKIATLTLNPALDLTMYFGDGLKFGTLNRAIAPSVTKLGGKGTNVSCILKLFGIESKAYGFVGGESGDAFLNLLSPYGIHTDFTRTKCATRTNVKIISESGQDTEFNEAGGPVEAAETKDLMAKIEAAISEADLFFMGGSVPLGIGVDIYKNILDMGEAINPKIKFALDCDGEALRLCMANKKKPFAIKPNRYELELFSGKRFDLEYDFEAALDEVKKEIKKIYEQTGVLVLCTLSQYGGLYCGDEGVFYVRAPKVKVKGFTGAGDTFFTSFVAAYFGLLDFAAIPRQTRCVCHPLSKGGLDAEQSLAFAVAAASAKVEKPGTEFATMQEIAVMHEKIKI